MRFAKIFVALAATTLMLAGCASQKEPAEKAMAQAESSVAEFRADAEKYAADELQKVDQSITKLKNALANKDYSMVVKAVPSLNSTIASLKQSVAAKKADADAMMAAAQAEWTDLSAKVPQMVEAIQSRVDTLGKSRKLPANVDKATWETREDRLRNHENRMDGCHHTVRFRPGRRSGAQGTGSESQGRSDPGQAGDDAG